MIHINSQRVQIVPFPNGESKIILPEIDPGQNASVKLQYESDADLFHLYLVKKELDEIGTAYTPLDVHYFPYSRMDRKQGQELFTLKHVAAFINQLNFSAVHIHEPHSDVTPALLDRVRVHDMSVHLFNHYFKDIAGLYHDSLPYFQDNDVVVFPDSGAQKRYGHQIKERHVLVGHKHRDWKTGDILSLELIGDVPVDGRAVIIDDLSSYGGTFMHTGNKLKEMGFKEVYLVVAHAEKSILERGLLDEDSPIDKVFTTNSIISKEDLKWKASAYRDKIEITNY